MHISRVHQLTQQWKAISSFFNYPKVHQTTSEVIQKMVIKNALLIKDEASNASYETHYRQEGRRLVN